MTVLVHESETVSLYPMLLRCLTKKNKLTSMFNNYNLLLLLSCKGMEWFERV